MLSFPSFAPVLYAETLYQLYRFRKYFLSLYFFVHDRALLVFHQSRLPSAKVRFRFSPKGLSSFQPVSGLEFELFRRPFVVAAHLFWLLPSASYQLVEGLNSLFLL